MKVAIALTPEQWEEIYYALESKCCYIKRGDYGGEPDDVYRWLSQLVTIRQIIQEKVPV